jgi:hypothetical protein
MRSLIALFVILFLILASVSSHSIASGKDQKMCNNHSIWNKYNISGVFPIDCSEIISSPDNTSKSFFSWNVKKDTYYPFEMKIKKVKEGRQKMPKQSYANEFESDLVLLGYSPDSYGVNDYSISGTVGKRANGTCTATGHKSFRVKFWLPDMLSDIQESQMLLEIIVSITDINGPFSEKESESILNSIRILPEV